MSRQRSRPAFRDIKRAPASCSFSGGCTCSAGVWLTHGSVRSAGLIRFDHHHRIGYKPSGKLRQVSPRPRASVQWAASAELSAQISEAAAEGQ
jgi:hypothetical protein